ncbi:G-protein coupled receptor 183 [Syngnathoides biaculeatus]|uniref:G-protein coupled receptor 183 n=1 Tax=Syngnathoides biaculeatus TaxID=300417 RepID=UPI002ADE1B2B|nr:G-protein coupled receptor 183 [Syngnathoides biaculeatus]
MAAGNNSSCDVFAGQRAAVAVFPAFYSLVFLVSACSNAVVLAVICRRQGKFNSTAAYLLNLALSDGLFALTLPGRVVYYVLRFDWPFGDLLCRTSTLLFFANTYAGIGFMTCISLDRYLAVVHPHRLRCMRRAKAVRRVCGAVWLLVSAQVAPVLSRASLRHHEGRRTCMEYLDLGVSRWTSGFLLLACVLSFFCPLAAILGSYARIRSKLLAAGGECKSASRRNRRANGIILLILLTFTVCFGPYHLNVMQFMWRTTQREPSCEDLVGFKVSSQITVSLMNFNCCLDPIIYFFAIKTYKKQMLSLLPDRLCASSSAPETTENSSTNS